MKITGTLFWRRFIAYGMLLALCQVLGPSYARAETAADNYKVYCAQCHGLSGSGGGINRADMPTNPRDHTSSEMVKLSDEDIYNAVFGGGVAVGKSTFMPPWKGVLTEDEMKDMVAFLRKLCNCKGR